VTPPLDGTILEGVTRQSILDLAKAHVDRNSYKNSKSYDKLFKFFFMFIGKFESI
jgi:branched-subunit amino acid aminotransferase/4-amino-4-deoxychorismate lyase